MDLIRDLSEHSSYRPTGGDLLKLFQLAFDKELEKEQLVNFFKSPSYLRKVKQTLKDRLLDGILLNSFSQLTKVQQAHFKIRRRNLEVMILIASEKKKAAIKVAEETLSHAEKYGLVDVALNMSRELEHHYSVVLVNTAKRDKYHQKNLRNQALFLQEIKAQSLFNDLAFCIQRKRITEHIPPAIEELSFIAKSNREYKFNLYYYSIKNLYARFTRNQSAIIENCRAAAAFFNQSRTILPYTTSWNFKFQLIPVYLMQRKYADAGFIIGECLELPNKGSYNWHLTLLYRAVLGFYSNKKMVALQAWKLAKKTPKKFDSAIVTERWKIVGAYLALSEKMGQIKYPAEFKIYRFLNDTTANATAKINMLILELLHLLADGKHDRYMDRVEHLESYIHTNCKGKPRAKYFLRMLKAVEVGDYNLIRVEAHAKKHRDLLRRTASTININVLDSEPVPYPVLWKMVLNHLRTKI